MYSISVLGKQTEYTDEYIWRSIFDEYILHLSVCLAS